MSVLYLVAVILFLTERGDLALIFFILATGSVTSISPIVIYGGLAAAAVYEATRWFRRRFYTSA